MISRITPIAATAVLLTGCMPIVHTIDVEPLATEPYPEVEPAAVRYVSPAPEGCEPVARLTSATPMTNGDQLRGELRDRAAALGANTLVVEMAPGRSSTPNVAIMEFDVLALRCP